VVRLGCPDDGHTSGGGCADLYFYIVPEFNGFDAELPPTWDRRVPYRTRIALSFSILYYWFYDSSLSGPDFNNREEGRKKEI
jgi:hypothetical protein